MSMAELNETINFTEGDSISSYQVG
jgi:hypothetical protein